MNLSVLEASFEAVRKKAAQNGDATMCRIPICFRIFHLLFARQFFFSSDEMSVFRFKTQKTKQAGQAIFAGLMHEPFWSGKGRPKEQKSHEGVFDILQRC